MSGVSSPTLGRIALRLIRPWRCPLRTTRKRVTDVLRRWRAR